MKLFKLLIVIIAMTVSLTIVISGAATADGSLTQKMIDRQKSVEWEKPSLSSPAAAQRAENLAIASARKADDKVTEAQQTVNEAKAALTEARNSGDQTEIDEARERYAFAIRALNNVVANSTGVSVEGISEMRTLGMGWEQIAYEIGVHPEVLGLGHADMVEVNELKMATARNAKTGLSVGHGTSHGWRGMGLDRTEAKKRIGRGLDGKGMNRDGNKSQSFAGGYGYGKGNGTSDYNGGGQGMW